MTLYTTLSPCQMCTGAILLFQIPRVVVGEAETFPGTSGSWPAGEWTSFLLRDERCVAVMKEFQERYPEVWSEEHRRPVGGRERSVEMFEHFGDHARRAVLPAAKDEAQRAGDRRIGTDHLAACAAHSARCGVSGGYFQAG